MSVESWARRASGLLVPTAGFAKHPLGRFQPCPGSCCFAPESCEDCSGSPESLWVDIPPLTDLGAEYCDCSDLDGTYQVTKQSPCRWESSPQATACDDGGIYLNGTFWISVSISYDHYNFPGVCSIIVQLNIGSNAWWLRWGQIISSFADPIDFPSVPCYGVYCYFYTMCGGVGTTAAVYE